MDKLNPKVVTAVTIAIVVLAGIIVFKTATGSHYSDAPPIAAGGPGAAKVTLPGGNVNGGAPPVAGAMGGGPGGAPPLGGNMTLPGAPPR